ncbi:MAG TPA: hypothetical protein VG897_00125, partial [Terriglobales bacterium]|nr:hypothetical protein [Terriglobales bacterium]
RFNKGRGFYVNQSTTKGENNANAGTWTNVTAENNDSDGFALAAATNNTIVGIDSEANKGVGLHFLAPAARNQIIGGDLNEGNVQGNLQFDSGTLGNVVQADVKNIPPYYADHSIGKFGSTNRVISSMVQDFGQIGISGSGYSQAGFGIGPTGGTGAALEVHGAFAGPLFGVVRISSDAGVPTMILRKARGTEQYPATVQSGDGIGRYYFGAYNGSRWISSAFFGSIIDGSVADGAVPGALVFDTCLLASNCIERVRISSTGEVGIGKTAERGVALDVKGEAAFSGGITTGNPGVAGHVVCWKDTTHIGYCSSQPDSGGSCYCN